MAAAVCISLKTSQKWQELPMAAIVSIIIADSLKENCPCWGTYIDYQLLKRSETLTRLSSTVTVQVLALQC
jgi:hypothetical protein